MSWFHKYKAGGMDAIAGDTAIEAKDSCSGAEKLS
jgi:hypothetical protein